MVAYMTESPSPLSKQYILGRILSDRIHNPDAYHAVIDELIRIQHDVAFRDAFSVYFIPVESKRIQNRIGYRLATDGLYHPISRKGEAEKPGLSAKEMILFLVSNKKDSDGDISLETKEAPALKSSSIKDLMAKKYGRVTMQTTPLDADHSARIAAMPMPASPEDFLKK